MYSQDYIKHHGVKGMKWGVRKYQYADGTYTPAGKRRYFGTEQNKSKIASIKSRTSSGKNYADTYLNKGTTFARIQTSKDFEKYAFYATYQKKDQDKYMGLFSKNLKSRAEQDAVRAEKQAKKTGKQEDLDTAKNLRDRADNIKTYQVRLETVKKLKVPSDENAADITATLLKDSKFRSNLEASIADSKAKMRRPTQQLLFNQAQNALGKDVKTLTPTEKEAVYKAFNLSLVYHNKEQIAAQNRFYSELRKKGYNAILDHNDKSYSSYHAKKPMIVFDVDSVKLQSVTETNPKVVSKLYTKYNTERIMKEISANTIGYVSMYGSKTVAECRSYMDRKFNSYLA